MDLKNILASLKKKKYEPSENKLGYSFVPLSHFEGYKLKLKARNIIVVVDGSGNVIDIFPKDQKDDMRDVYTQKLAENTEQDSLRQVKIEKENERKKKSDKLILEQELKLGLNREKNIKLLNAMKEEPEKIEGRFNDAEARYRTARKNLADYVEKEMEDADENRNPEIYQRKLRELQNTDGYALLAQKEIDALKRFFKVSNALSGLSEELALTNPEYQAIDYNKRVQDIVTTQTPREKHQGENIFEYISSGGHTAKNIIPEDAPTSPMGYKKKVRDYVSQEDAEKELERTKPKSVLSGVVEGKREGESSEEYSKRMLETVSEQPKATGFSKFSTDELLKLLIEENKKPK